MIDHSVKKILTYELTDLICKNIHGVLGAELESAMWQNRIREAGNTNRAIKGNTNFNEENLKGIKFMKCKKIMPGTTDSMGTENQYPWYRSRPIFGI